MLSSLQREVALIVAGIAEADGFALAGGAALILRGDVDRRTRDLDFFGPSVDAVDRLVPAAIATLRRAGLEVRSILQSPGFARVVVMRGVDSTEVDFGADARLFTEDRTRLVPTLSAEELAVDKVLAIFGRAEARDFADLMALEPRFGLERLCALAAEKDGGFSPAVLAAMLSQFHRLRRDEFDLDNQDYERLSARVAEWRERALSL